MVIDPIYEWSSGLYAFPFLTNANERERILQHFHNSGYHYFDAPGSTKPLFDQPLFLGSTDVFHRLVKPEVATAYPNAMDFHSKIIKLTL